MPSYIYTMKNYVPPRAKSPSGGGSRNAWSGWALTALTMLRPDQDSADLEAPENCGGISVGTKKPPTNL